jgi:hypothetical protein
MIAMTALLLVGQWRQQGKDVRRNELFPALMPVVPPSWLQSPFHPVCFDSSQRNPAPARFAK